jgi:hypothetical protein
MIMGPESNHNAITTTCLGCHKEIVIELRNVEKELHCTICGAYVDPSVHSTLSQAIQKIKGARRARRLEEAEAREQRQQEKAAKRESARRAREMKESQSVEYANQVSRDRRRNARLREIAKRIRVRHRRAAELTIAFLLLLISAGLTMGCILAFRGAESVMHEIFGLLLLVAAAIIASTAILIMIISEIAAFLGLKLDAICDLLRWQGGLAEDEAEANALRGRLP